MAPPKEDPEIEEVDNDDEEDVEVDENDPAAGDKIQSRGEKKARKLLAKHDLKLVEGITRVTIRRPRNVLFVIANPQVYKSAGSDTYIVYGEVKVEDMNAPSQPSAEAFRAQDILEAGKTLEIPDAADEDDGDTDETGVEQKDIELVMSQAGVSRGKAVKALKAHNGDIVNAIMELTA